MTHTEFLKVCAYLTAGTGKDLIADSKAVYWDCLKDMPFEVMMASAQKVLMEHPWATFPSVAELRQAASETIRGKVNEVSPSEAWMMARKVAAGYDPDLQGSYWAEGKLWPSQFAFLIHRLPVVVVKAIREFGVLSLSVNEGAISIVRAQFIDTFRQVAAREKREALLPDALKQTIAETGECRTLPPKIVDVIAAIGAAKE